MSLPCGCDLKQEKVCEEHFKRLDAIYDDEWHRMLAKRQPWMGYVLMAAFGLSICGVLLKVFSGFETFLLYVSLVGLICAVDLVVRRMP